MCQILHRNKGAVSMKSSGPNLATPPDGGLPQVQICDSVFSEEWAESRQAKREQINN